MIEKYPTYPDEGERNREDLVELLFNYAAKLILLGSWCNFHFDSWSNCLGGAQVDWYIGDAINPDYGSCTEKLYLNEEDGLFAFNEVFCIEWIDCFHTFLIRHQDGLNIDGDFTCINCHGTNTTLDKDCDKYWCIDCDDWAHLESPGEHEPREDEEL